MDLGSQDRDFTEKFIKIYKDSPCLWKTSSPSYKDRICRLKGYEKLVNLMRELNPGADVPTVRRKIESLRAIWRTAKKKVIEKEEEGVPYCPPWVHYESLRFLEKSDTNDTSDSDNEQDDGNYWGDEIGSKNIPADIQVNSNVRSDHQKEDDKSIVNKNLKVDELGGRDFHFTERFIKLFKEEPCLWKRSMIEYKEKYTRIKSYEKLLNLLKEVNPQADFVTVRRKIESIRGAWRSARSKMLKMHRSGFTSYRPSWAHYGSLNFLANQDEIEMNQSDSDNQSDDENYWGDELNNKGTDSDVNLSSLKVERKSPRMQKSVSRRIDELAGTNKEFTRKFIRLYKQETSLWKRNSPEYMDKRTKQKSYDKLLNLMREIHPDADLMIVRRKIDSLRASWRSARKKVFEKRQQGVQYHSSWEYYKSLKFLADEEDGECLKSDSDIPPEDENSGDSFDKSLTEFIPVVNSNVRKKKKKPPPSTLSSKKFKNNKKVIEKFDSNDSNSAYVAFGKYIAIELSNMDEGMSTYCRKMISDAIYQAQMGQLNYSSKITTDR